MSARYRRVEVTWEDSVILDEGAWTNIVNALSRRGRTRCTTIGILLADDKRGVVVAGSIHGLEAAGIMVIPRGQVLKRRRLR